MLVRTNKPVCAPLKDPPFSTYCHLLEEQIASLIQQCTSMRNLRQIHAHFLRHPLTNNLYFLSKILVFCVSPRGDLGYARQVFDQMPNPNVFSFNTMIRGYFSHSHDLPRGSFLLYKKMLNSTYANPNSFTYAFLLKNCSAGLTFVEGHQLHCHILQRGFYSSLFVQTGLLNFYAKCEDIGSARLAFDENTEKNLIAWSIMIGGYARIGMVNEALSLFQEMQSAGIMPDEVTMVAVILACARAGALDLGKWVHAFIGKKGLKVDLELSTALVEMYSKCGLIEKAQEVFDEMPERDAMAWSSMIVGLANHGLVKDALNLFDRMLESKVKPNQVAFIGVLSACAHSGLVNEGRWFWNEMRELQIKPTLEHYGCMVDLLCRSGLIEDAFSFVTTMPIKPNSVIWRTLLVGCKHYRNSDQVEVAKNRLLELEPLNSENYVLISNLYASNSQWDRVSQMRKKMNESGLKVMPGISSIEIDGFVHSFVVGDDSHPEIKDIRGVLLEIAERARLIGHKPLTSAVLHDVGEDEKKVALCEHSERLAIAYGLLKIEAPAVIRVVKNLRFCADCHEVTKIISKSYGRKIVVRDRVRFHCFVDGACSCNDFW